MKKLAIITTHPIQYNAPLFARMADSKILHIKVFYTWEQSAEKVYDPDFGKEIAWDIPLLSGYDYMFLENKSKSPGSHHYKGIDNPSLIKEVIAWGADAVLIYGWSYHSHLNALRHFKGKIPVLFRGDSTLLDEKSGFSIKKFCRRIFLTWVYSHINWACYVGKANKKYYKAHYVADEKLEFAPHAIDNERFIGLGDSFEMEAKLLRRQLGVGENNITFLFAGKLIPKKAPDLLISAFLSLAIHNATLIIVGNGEMEAKLRQKYNEEKKVIFLDAQNQSRMPVIYRLCDVFCLPSNGPGETWGLAVNEAMACGKPVLISDKVGCGEDLVLQGRNGYVFKSGDFVDLQSKLKLLVARRNDLEEMGKISLETIKNYNYLSIIKALETILEK